MDIIKICITRRDKKDIDMQVYNNNAYFKIMSFSKVEY